VAATLLLRELRLQRRPLLLHRRDAPARGGGPLAEFEERRDLLPLLRLLTEQSAGTVVSVARLADVRASILTSLEAAATMRR